MPSSTSTVGLWNCAESCSIKPTVIVRSHASQRAVAAMQLPLADVIILDLSHALAEGVVSEPMGTAYR